MKIRAIILTVITGVMFAGINANAHGHKNKCEMNVSKDACKKMKNAHFHNGKCYQTMTKKACEGKGTYHE